MRRRPRQISLKECYAILKLEKDADMAAVKRAYRRRAFELHPDLNPDNPDASREFQSLNEAYVALSAVLKHEEGVRAATRTRGAATGGEASERADGPSAAEQPADGGKTREDASSMGKGKRQKAQAAAEATTEGAGEKASSDEAGATRGPGSRGEDQERNATAGDADDAKAKDKAARDAYSEQDVLRDLLNDPFARRVFEDIYSELNRQQQEESAAQAEDPAPEQPTGKAEAKEKRNVRLHKSNLAWGTSKWSRADSKGVTGMVKGWLRKQIDEEQSLALPAANLAPGRRVRLQIRQAFSGELKTVDITLPPDFAVGKPIRLRGLGKRVGPWQGDLYLILTNE